MVAFSIFVGQNPEDNTILLLAKLGVHKVLTRTVMYKCFLHIVPIFLKDYFYDMLTEIA